MRGHVERQVVARLAVIAALTAAVLPAGDAWAGFTASGGPSARVVANGRVEVRWIADFVGEGRVELFDNPDGTGTPGDTLVSISPANDHTLTVGVDALVRPDTTYYFRVTHRDPTGNLSDWRGGTWPPLPASSCRKPRPRSRT